MVHAICKCCTARGQPKLPKKSRIKSHTHTRQKNCSKEHRLQLQLHDVVYYATTFAEGGGRADTVHCIPCRQMQQNKEWSGGGIYVHIECSKYISNYLLVYPVNKACEEKQQWTITITMGQGFSSVFTKNFDSQHCQPEGQGQQGEHPFRVWEFDKFASWTQQ